MSEIPAYVQEILQKMTDGGFEAWCVGGCVRDTLLGRVPGDWDVTTSARPEETMALFGARSIPTGIQHGTVTVRTAEQPVEVTTYRCDGTYADHRHPDSVTFSGSLREDLRRRDFTVNAMAMDLHGNLADPFDGQADLRQRILRCVGEPERRFQEDALRILRGLRFASVLGFTLEKNTARALRAQRALLGEISAERIQTELVKLLCGPDVCRILLEFSGVLQVVLPEIAPSVGFDQRNCHHCYDVWEHTARSVAAVSADPVLRMTMLLHDLGKPASFTLDTSGVGHFLGHAKISRALGKDILERLRFSTEEREAILLLVEHHDRPIAPAEKSVRRALMKFGERNFRRLLAVKRADNLAQAPAYLGRQREYDAVETILERLLAQNACFSLRQLAVNGRDMLNAGFRGPAVGKILDELLRAVVDGRLPNDRETLLQAAKEKRYGE
jgi:tRNA nucleotidyltransferase (CCA-adding enzyme)